MKNKCYLVKVKINDDPDDIYFVSYNVPNNFICRANSEEHAKEKAIKYYQKKILEVTVIDVKEFQYFYYENMVVEVESEETDE